jgi:hypothetical protein
MLGPRSYTGPRSQIEPAWTPPGDAPVWAQPAWIMKRQQLAEIVALHGIAEIETLAEQARAIRRALGQPPG